MREQEIKLIKDLYKHFQPETEVTEELITSCYDQYGSIRGVLMNLILKFEPNANITDEYLNKKLASYGLMQIENPENQKPPESKEEILQDSVKVTQKETAPSDPKKNNKTKRIVYIFLIVTTPTIATFVFFEYFNGENKIQPVQENTIFIDTSAATEEDMLLEDVTQEDMGMEDEMEEIIYPVDVIELLSNYYSDLNNDNFDANNYFSQTIDQFINLKNTNPSEINSALNNSDYQNGLSIFVENSLACIKGEGGLLIWTYWIRYNCYRPSKNKYQECNVKVEIGIELTDSKELFIYSYNEVRVQDLKFYDNEKQNALGVINDPDGYTNIRANKSSSSEVIYEIYENKKFEILDDNSEWWKIKFAIDEYPYEIIGFIHYSRVERIDNEDDFERIDNEDDF